MGITKSYSANWDINSLRAYIVFCERLNFTHAAEDLHISQPALFVKIQSLGKELATPLYRKVGQRLELTPSGKSFLAFARDSVENADAFLEHIQGNDGPKQVVLAAGEGAFLYLLGPAIQQFQKSGMPLQLLTGNRDEVVDAVCSARAHLGVASMETVPLDCESSVFHVADQVLVMRDDHPLANKRRPLLRHLQGEHLIVPPADRQHRQVLAQALQSEGVNWHVAVEASGWELMIKFVKLGLGVAVVNSICMLPRGVVGKPLTELPRIHYHLFHLKSRTKHSSVETLKRGILSSSPS